MRKRMIGCIGVVALAAAPFAMAQTPQPETMPERESTLQQETTETRTVTGRVAEVDADSLVVETSAGQRMTFTADRDLTQGPTPIRVGSQVRVEYRGESELQVVSVSPVPGTPPDAANIDPADDPDGGELEDDDDAALVTDSDDDGLDDDNGLELEDDDNGLELEDDDNGTTVARVQTTQPERAGAAAARTIDPDDDGELPGTASPLPLLLIAGLSLLGGGVGLSARRRR